MSHSLRLAAGLRSGAGVCEKFWKECWCGGWWFGRCRATVGEWSRVDPVDGFAVDD